MRSMAGEINKLIPLYGELNRIYNDWVTNYAFSFDKQKFITDFYRQHNDTKAFESAILELVLDKHKEQYTLILNSLKIEIEKNIRAYETKPLNDDIIKRVCFHYADRRNSAIRDQFKDSGFKSLCIIVLPVKIGDEFLLVKRKSIIGHPIIIYPVEQGYTRKFEIRDRKSVV